MASINSLKITIHPPLKKEGDPSISASVISSNLPANWHHLMGGLLVLGAILFSLPTVAQENVITNPQPLILPSGTVEDLQGIESKDASQWLGGVGGESDEGEGVGSVYEVNQSSYDAKAQALNSTLDQIETQVGDVERPTTSFPFAQF
jgi:hypothetical protein